MIFASERRVRHWGRALTCAGLLLSACAGKAEQEKSPPSIAGGGGSGAGDGTDAGVDTVGGADPGVDSGVDTGAAGEIDPNSGGGASLGGASVGGAPGLIGHCDKVICDPLPATCKRIVQAAGDCCPTCPDTGCDVCPDIDCQAGTHSETAPGDCCPSCVADPPDACAEGQKNYAASRAQMLDKYGSVGCKNSSQCTLLKEDNACGYACNIPLPSSSAQNLLPNLDSDARQCATCQPPDKVDCDSAIPACVNGKCVAAEAQP